MTNEEAAEVLGNLNPEDDMSAMDLLPKQPEIIDISKPKKGKGARIQKLVADLSASATHFTSTTRDAAKRKPAPIKEVYNPDKLVGRVAELAEARKLRTQMRLEEDAKSKALTEEGYILPKTKQLALDDVDGILATTSKNTAEEYWAELRAPAGDPPSYTVEQSNATTEILDDQINDDFEDPTASPGDSNPRETILLYPSRLSRAFGKEEPTPQRYLYNPNASVLYTLPSDIDEASVKAAESTSGASVPLQLYPYKRAIMSLEHEFKVLLNRTSIDYTGVAAYRDSVWRKFVRVNEILTSIMNHVRGLNERIESIEVSELFHNMLGKKRDAPASVTSNKALNETLERLMNDISDLKEQSDYHNSILSEKDPDTNELINVVGTTKDHVEELRQHIQRVSNTAQSNAKKLKELVDSEGLRLDEEIAYAEDARSRLLMLEETLASKSNDSTVSDLNARVTAIEAKPTVTSAIDEVKFREQLHQIDVRLSDMATSLVQHNQRMVDSVIDSSKYATEIASVNGYLKQTNADLNDVAKMLNSHIEEQRVISAHLFGLQSSKIRYSDSYESAISIVHRLSKVEEQCQTSLPDHSVFDTNAALNRLSEVESQLGEVPTVLNRLAVVEQQIADVAKHQHASDPMLLARVTAVEQLANTVNTRHAPVDPVILSRLTALELQVNAVDARLSPLDAVVSTRLAALEQQMMAVTARQASNLSFQPQNHVTHTGVGSVYSTPTVSISALQNSSQQTTESQQVPSVFPTLLQPAPQYITANNVNYEVPPVNADPLFARSFDEKRAISIMNSEYLADRDNQQRKTSCYDMSGHKFNVKVDDSLKFDPSKLADLPVVLGLALSKFDLSGMLNETEYIVWDSLQSKANLDYIVKVHRSRLHLIFLVLQIIVGRTEDASKRSTYSQILLAYGSANGDRASGIAALRLLKDEAYGTTYGDRATALKHLQTFRQDLDSNRRMDNRTYYTHKKELIATCANFNMTADEIYRVMFLDGMSAEHSFCYRNILSASSIPSIDDMFTSMEVNQSALNQQAERGAARLMSIVPSSSVVTQTKGHAMYTTHSPVRDKSSKAIVPYRKQENLTQSDPNEPQPNVSSTAPCPFHLQVKGHRLCGATHHNGVCYIPYTAEKRGLDIQAYIKELNQHRHDSQRKRSRSKSPYSSDASTSSKYGPGSAFTKKRSSNSPHRKPPRSKSPSKGDARAATTSPHFTGGSLD